MAFSSLGSLKEALFGKAESEEHWPAAATEAKLSEAADKMRREIDQMKYEMLQNQVADKYQQLGPSGFQNALVQQGMHSNHNSNFIYAAQQARIQQLQAEYEQKFREEAEAKGAVSSAELDSVAYSLSLEEVRTLWLAAFGSKWVALESMEGDHRLMFQRLHANSQFEIAIVTDPATRTFKTRYRLKGT